MARDNNYKPGVIYISPSQVSTFRDCPRKWAYRYIDKIKFPPKPEQAFGLEGHERNEKYLGPEREKHGDDDVGKVCQQGVKKGHLPIPADDLLIEQKIEIPIFGGKAMMIGYVDCVKPPRPKGKGEDKLPIVHDWKFTKDLRWAMKAAELDDDPQAAVYAKATFIVYEDAQEVIDRWIYFCGRVNKKSEDGRPRTPRGVRRVQQTYTRAQVDEMWDAVMKTAREIIKTKTTFKKAEEVEPNQLHCDAYGGCPHKEYCPLPESVGLGARMEQYDKTHKKKSLTRDANGDNDAQPSDGGVSMSETDLLSQLRAQGEANTASGKPAETKTEPEKPPAESSGEPDPNAEDLLAKLGGGKGKEAEKAAETKAEPEKPAEEKTAATAESPGGGDDFLSRMQAQSGAGTAVNPPADAEKPAPAPESSNESAAEPDSSAEDLLAKLGGGKGKKSEAPPETKAETPAETKPDSQTEKTAEEPEKSKKKRAPSKKKGSAFILAIDVAQVKSNGELGEVVHLSDFLQPITDYIAKEWKNKDYPDGIGHWGLIPYGEGKAYLARQVENYLDKHGFKGVLLVDGGTAEGAAVKDALIRRADVVLRAQR